GALPVLLAPRRPSARRDTLLLAFAAGVMLAATAFSLIIPGIDAAAERLGGPGLRPALLVAAATLLGGGVLALVHRLVPHEHFVKGLDGPATQRVQRL